jgi:hypothetical protein
VSAIALLMGLLVLSYLGSLLVGSGKTRGLASGIEFIGLGFAVGPHALGLVDRAMIANFAPIIDVALGWLAFIIGLDFGRVDGRRVRVNAIAHGIGGAVLTGAVVFGVVSQLLSIYKVPGIGPGGALILALGAAAVCAETSGFGVQWVQQRWGAKGPISTLLMQMGAADDLAPLVVAGVIFALAPADGLLFSLPAVGMFGASLALGALLGIVTAMLLRGAEGGALWGGLIGSLLLVVGTAARFGVCTIFVTFVMGIALAAASPGRRALRKMVGPTERSILFPLLLLAGARLDPRPLLENRVLGAVVAAVILARIAGKLLSGVLVRLGEPAAKPGGFLLGIVLLSSGPVSTSCGLLFALRFPGAIGDTLLVCAAASAVLGEVVSTLALKALLVEAGEIAPAGAVVIPAPAPPPPPPNGGARGSSRPPPPLESQIALEDEAGQPSSARFRARGADKPW